MYEYIFKGFQCVSTGMYSYQIIEENPMRIFTNDPDPISYLFKIHQSDMFEITLESTSQLDQLLSSDDPRGRYFKYLVTNGI